MKFTRIDNNQIYVKSKIKGITIAELIYGRYNLTEGQIISIARQIVNIITSLWARGIAHHHPQYKNWVVRFENGIPRVKLIDFKYAIRKTQYTYSNSINQDHTNSRQTILHLFSKLKDWQKYFKIFERILENQYKKYKPIKS